MSPFGMLMNSPQSEFQRMCPQERQKQLQIITHRWRTIELEAKKNQKGRRIEDASSRQIEKKLSADPTPHPLHTPVPYTCRHRNKKLGILFGL